MSAAKFGWRHRVQRDVGRWPSLHGPIIALLKGQKGLCLLKGKCNRHFRRVRRPLIINLVLYTPTYWPSVLRWSKSEGQYSKIVSFHRRRAAQSISAASDDNNLTSMEYCPTKALTFIIHEV